MATGLRDTRGRYPDQLEAKRQREACNLCNALQHRQGRLIEALAVAREAVNAASSALAMIELRAGELEDAALAHGSGEGCNA
jgi:hypothetical protein